MMRLIAYALVTVMVLTGCSMASNWKQEHKTRQFVEDAVETLERDGASALTEFRGDAWRDGPLYLFIFQLDGVQLFHAITPETEGQNRSELTDIHGKKLVKEMLSVVVDKGYGWTEYHWLNPVSGNVEAKRSFVSSAMMDGEEVLIGAGYYYQE